MFTFVFLSPSPPSTTEIFSKTPKMPCLAPHISETIELNQKRLKNLLTNFLGSFQIRKDPLSDIGTLSILDFVNVFFSLCSLFIIVYLHQQFLDVRTSFLTKETYKNNVFVFGILKLLIIKTPNGFRLATYVMLKHYNPIKDQECIRINEEYCK